MFASAVDGCISSVCRAEVKHSVIFSKIFFHFSLFKPHVVELQSCLTQDVHNAMADHECTQYVVV